MPKVSVFDLVFKIFLVTLAISIIGLASAGISYAQLQYAQDLFIAILVLTIIAFIALVVLCFFVEPSTQKYDLSKAEKGKHNKGFEGSEDGAATKNDQSKLDNMKWNLNYVPYSEVNSVDEKNKKTPTKKEEAVVVEQQLDNKLQHDNSGEEKKDSAEKAGDSWKKNYVPYEEDSEVDHTKALSKPRELHEDSNKQVEDLKESEKEDK